MGLDKPTVAILGGTGKEGPGLAMRWADAGYQIIIGSRQYEKAKITADELNLILGMSSITGLQNSDAAQRADISVLTVVQSSHRVALESLKDSLQGKILVDGYTAEERGFVSLQKQVGVALQEPYLWNDTIENNIRYAKTHATQQEIIETAKLVGVDDFVKQLPRGYATVIGENACKLSEGQKQKIAIARALIKKPKILILDEAMASMDSLSEQKIIQQIKYYYH